MELRYTAIVLKKKEVGETDRLYTLYTEEQGKVRVVAKGVRKPEAKLASQLETLTYGLVIVVKGRGMGKIAGAVAEDFFPQLRNDFDILKRILESISVFERLVDLDEPDSRLFGLLKTYLSLAEALVRDGQSEKVFLLSEGFLFQLFAHLGYEVETGACVVSGEKLRQGDRHFFSPGQGGMLSGEHSAQSRGAFAVSENTIKLIRLFLSNRLEHLPRITAEARELRELRQVAASFLQWIVR
ncbi:MAG: DNA repair protein RecO [Candidatus Moranbacteria bacterium]|nr:DNA repair protein RecO [Candidatus Moranbacteria bacterium]MBP6034080.1 DNA repair protein RecO [Candidatus Moranbacteria bacterium]MBP7695832.1 DNA repair protein RecO [Candidatus Moranbacteria bacterium]